MRTILIPLLLLLLTAQTAAPLALPPRPDAPGGLRCEGSVAPLGIDVPRPRLSWIVPARRGILQTGFQILVSSNETLFSKEHVDLWNSGRVSSSNSIGVGYAGKGLASGSRCFWKVRIWDEKGMPSSWSETSSWTVGLLSPSDWQGGQWEGDRAVIGVGAGSYEFESDF